MREIIQVKDSFDVIVLNFYQSYIGSNLKLTLVFCCYAILYIQCVLFLYKIYLLYEIVIRIQKKYLFLYSE